MKETKPEPHPGTAAIAISAMGVVVAVVLGFVGILRLIDGWVLELEEGIGLQGELRELPVWPVWAWTLPMTFGICWAILHVAGHWRRIVLSISALVLTVAWIPVLALAGWVAPVGVPLVALLWGCVGSLVYAARHRELEGELV